MEGVLFTLAVRRGTCHNTGGVDPDPVKKKMVPANQGLKEKSSLRP